MYCKNCGNQLNENVNFCNQCGKVIAQDQVQQQDDNPAMVFSISGFVLSFFSSIAGLILSIIAYKKYKKQQNQQYKGLSIAGLVISGIGCASAAATIISSILGTVIYCIVMIISLVAFASVPLI